MSKIKLFSAVIALLGIMLFQACTDYKYIDENAFIGTWELKGRELYSGMKVHIEKEGEQLKGYVVTPPDNKLGQVFFEKDKMWVTDIKRGANYYFKVTERKVASELFAEYELAKDSEFYATFSENRSRIYLIRQRPNKFIEESDIYYERIK